MKKLICLILLSMLFPALMFKCEEETQTIPEPTIINNSNDNLFLSDRFLNIAHSGGERLRPQETIIAFEYSLEVGADVIEFDIHRTKDGVLVARHDFSVDSTTDGTGTIADMTFEQIQELDAGYRFYVADGDNHYPYRGIGVQIPSVEEIFETFPDEYMIIEIKQYDPPIEEDLVNLIHTHNMEEQVIIAASVPGVISEVRRLNPDLLTSFSLDEMFVFIGLTDTAELDYTPPAKFIHSPIQQSGIYILDEDFVERTNRLELIIHAWTINDIDEMNMLIELGIQGIMTDYPNILEDLLIEKGLSN